MPRYIVPLTLMLLSLLLVGAAAPGHAAEEANRLGPVNTDKRLNQLQIERHNGTYTIRLEGQDQAVSAERFLAQLYAQQHRKETNFLFVIFNITSWVNLMWVSVGLLGQVFFTGRMVVQWITSERKRRSVIPVAFWWMSLLGACMLLLYFIWRKDIVGILGQSTGLFIYLRNLRLIYRERRSSLTAS
ncbi:lipid-A-disaccharide synthase N-terminal domain-containing protein [Desulfohalobium retbaense]|nr:lipid-A-disaccharide synthase N-terminal domain-containing protein [Desulfohalobium retbaense]